MDLRKSGISRIKQCAINASPLLGRYVSATQRHKVQVFTEAFTSYKSGKKEGGVL